MSNESQCVRVMAWVQSVEDQKCSNGSSRHYFNGWIMFVKEECGGVVEDQAISNCGRYLDDFLDISNDLDPAGKYPAFMAWDGFVEFTSDDFLTRGSWRRASSREIISASKGQNPWK